MRVYIANFGRENYEWPVCLQRASIATMNEVDVQPFWEAGDREAYVQLCLARKNAVGITPTRSVASRWFNLMNIIAETAGDMWIHRAKDEFWWTRSRDGLPTYEEKVEPIARGARVVVCHKPCEPWSDRDAKGRRLRWDALHPKAREFLFTEGTLQQLTTDNALYASALLEGGDLTPWHSRPAWRSKTTIRLGKGGPVTVFDGRRKAAWRMTDQAYSTAASASGQQVMQKVKNKEVVGFSSRQDLENYILELLGMQEGLCALTDLRMQLDGEEDDRQMLCSLDRIDSDGHYERGNLQVVCQFANRWKGARDDDEFRRLIQAVRSVALPI